MCGVHLFVLFVAADEAFEIFKQLFHYSCSVSVVVYSFSLWSEVHMCLNMFQHIEQVKDEVSSVLVFQCVLVLNVLRDS